MSYTNAEVDIIFAGGGTAACLIAGRLAAADPSLKILVVEAGPHTLDDLMHIQPARYLTHMMPGSKTMKFMISKPSDHLGGRASIIPAAQCVGGGSSVNFVMYNRAAASDYDDWETIYNNPGWGSKDLIPLLNKTETYQIDPENKIHGSSGPLLVSWGGHFTNIGKDFLDVAAKYDKERRSTDDPNNMFTANTYARFPKWINGKTGHRSDVPHHFIYTQSHNKNLRILPGCFVKRIVFSGTRAVGVEYTSNPQLHPEVPSEPTIVYAGRLVVVSGGALGSPLILERSGIGASTVLEKNSVKQLVDLPGVGERYQDHQIVVPLYHASDNSDTLDGIMLGAQDEVEKWNTQWTKNGSGMMANNGLDAGIKYRPTKEELNAIGPAYEAKWKSLYADALDRAPMWLGTTSFNFGAIMTAPKGKYFGCAYALHHPSSLGHVHITSGEDPSALPDFDTAYLEHEEDMALLVWAYKRSREFARRMPCYRGEYLEQHPEFAKGSEAGGAEEDLHVDIGTPEIQYTEEDNKAIRAFTRKFVNTTWHALGTCAMMPREQGGVVDSHLNVYGVEGLKVADLSIAPSNVGANTYSTALVVAEKATLIIADELGITGV